MKKGFTLLELMVVVVIVGILSALGASQYTAAKEKAIDKEAEANLRLIMAAERMFRMENGVYIAAGSNALVNTNLRLALPVTAPNWNFAVNICPNDCCASGTRTVGSQAGRKWYICSPTGGVPDPQPQTAAGCACGCP